MRQSPQLLQHLHPANMCTYYYLHYHHLAPCTRDVEYAVHYSFCPNAIPDISSANPPSSVNTGVTEHGEQWIQQPCEGLTYAPEYSPVEGVDYNSPCATGGCLVSHKCSSGGCRLEDLGGRTDEEDPRLSLLSCDLPGMPPRSDVETKEDEK